MRHSLCPSLFLIELFIKMESNSEQIQVLAETLEKEYGVPERSSTKSPLDTLIGTILSQNTSDTNSRNAYESLREEFPTWSKVHNTPVEDIADAIRSGGLANQKSHRIKRVLDWLHDHRGSLEMDWICDEDPYEILQQFTDIKGIGVKTISIVLCFNCRHDVFPVDTHVNRVAGRLGLVSEKSSPNRTFRKLDPIIPEGKSLTLHLNMIRHGREVCKSRNPRCGECVLLDMCEYGQRDLKGAA